MPSRAGRSTGYGAAPQSGNAGDYEESASSPRSATSRKNALRKRGRPDPSGLPLEI